MSDYIVMARKRKFQDIAGEDFMYNGKYSDLTIRCGGRDFKAHKIFICRASPTIEALVARNTAEAATGAIEEEDFDEITVERWLKHIYTQATSMHHQFFQTRSPTLEIRSTPSSLNMQNYTPSPRSTKRMI